MKPYRVHIGILVTIAVALYLATLGPQRSIPAEEAQVRELVKRVSQSIYDWNAEYHTGWTGGKAELLEGNTLTEAGEAFEQLMAEKYEAALRPLLCEGVPLQVTGYSWPPKHEPELEKITRVDFRDGAYLVRTQLARGENDIEYDYEYRVMLGNGEPKLASLMWVFEGERVETLSF